MSGNPSPDERALKAVETELDKSLYVEAGAGTGKTRALVSRLTSLLADSNVAPAQVAAITFTRAAAFEMRSRVRASLEELADRETCPERAKNIQDALDSLDTAAIQTIHSFALSLLRERPLAAGLPPVVTPMDEIQEGIDFDERWAEWISARLEAGPELAVALGIAQRMGLDRPLEKLRSLATELADQHHLLKRGMFEFTGKRSDGLSVDHVKRVITEAEAIVAAAPVAEDRMCLFVEETVIPGLEGLLAAVEGSALIDDTELVDLPRISPNRNNGGNKGNWSKAQGGVDQLERLRGILGDLQEEIDAIVSPLKSQAIAALLNAAVEFTLECVSSRKRIGSLTFHDQLVIARDLLRDPAVRSYFRDRYRVLLVDEFQDTDPVQVEILRLLSGFGGQDASKANLFLVGDPKQSIYRFRGADPSVAGSFSADVSRLGATFPLSQNHRSQRPVLQWVNHVFSSWMSAHESSGQARYEPLTSPDGEMDGFVSDVDVSSVRWFGGEVAGSAGASRSIEFTEISWIAREAGLGAFTVRDKNGFTRPSRFGDVAVLVKNRTGMEELEDKLVDNRVPYVFEGQSPLFTSQDVRDLRACLMAIDDPSDQVATLAALRGPAYACSDPDLLRWKLNGGTFFYLDEVPAGDAGPVADAFESLCEFHRMSREIPLVRLVELFIRKRRLREKAVLSRTGPERVRRLNMVVELAASVSNEHPVTLRDFTTWMQRQTEENARIPETVSEAADQNATRVMTMHASKGLEFPIVILASARPNSGRNDPAQVQVWRDGANVERLDIQLGNKDLGFRSDGFEQGKEQDKLQGELEDTRLMYVAATRARDHLLVSRRRGVKERNALIVKIEEFMQEKPDLWAEWIAPQAEQEDAVVSQDHPDTARDRNIWKASREQLISHASRRGYVTPTGLKRHDIAIDPLPKEESENFDGEPGRFGRGAAERGRAVHGVLQHISLLGWSADDLSGLASRMADAHGIPDDADEIIRLSKSVLSTDTLRKAMRAASRGKAWREISVAAPVDDTGGALEGQVDLLYEDEDGDLVLVDYKTDRVPGGDTAEAAAPYVPQMGAYAWAVEKLTGKRVKQATLIFARLAATDGAGEYTLPDLPSHKDEAARLARESLSDVTPAR